MHSIKNDPSVTEKIVAWKLCRRDIILSLRCEIIARLFSPRVETTYKRDQAAV